MALILIVEDEQDMADLLKRELELEGHAVRVAYDGKAALTLVETIRFDLVILDWMLPELDGLSICRRIRRGSIVPIIMVTAKAEETDRILGLEVGADDYVTKPFSLQELLARVRAILRRMAFMTAAVEPEDKPIKHGCLTIIPTDRCVLVSGDPLELTLKEYELILLLASHPGRSFSRNYLLDQIWGDDYEGTDRTVDTHMVRLRKKLGVAGAWIQTLWGIGYRFSQPKEP